MKRVFTCALALLMTAALAALYPFLEEGEGMPEEEKTVVVWMQSVEDGGASFLKKAASAYEKETKNRVYLRTCSKDEAENVLAGVAAVVPDMMVLEERGVPIFCRGYVLVVPDAENMQPTAPPAPALFQRPTATPALSTPPPRPFPDKLEKVALPSVFEGAVEGGYVSETPLSDLTNKKAKAALLTPPQVLQMQGEYQVHVRGDFFLPVMGLAMTETEEDFLAFLLSLPVQEMLKEQKLFSAYRNLSLYSPDTPLLSQMENARKNKEK